MGPFLVPKFQHISSFEVQTKLLQEYIFLACEETLGDFGQDLDCNTAPLGGECGSGQFADCDGNAHGVSQHAWGFHELFIHS